MNSKTTSLRMHESPRNRWRNRLLVVGGALVFSAIVFRVSGFPEAFENWWNAPVKQDASKRLSANVNPVPVQAVTPPAPSGNDSSVSKVPLPLILVATEVGRTPADGIALLGVKKESPQTYQFGAILANGARLAEITTDYVVLTKNGKSVKLYRDGLPQVTKVSEALSAMLTVGGERPYPVAAPEPARSVLSTHLRPNAVYQGNTIKGFEVYAADGSSALGRMGLQAGDVITAFNDVPLTDRQVAATYFDTLAQGVSMTATVSRKGEILKVTLDGALMAQADRAQHTTPLGMPPGG
jgi:type II secretion system protein C